MESPGKLHSPNFELLIGRLLAFVKLRIQNGDFTERGLAKVLGVSQSHIHNVLKGARSLRPDLADRLFRRFDMSVLDLLEAGELYEELLARGPVSTEASTKPSAEAVAVHLPPKRLDTGDARKKPPIPEWRTSAARAGKLG